MRLLISYQCKVAEQLVAILKRTINRSIEEFSTEKNGSIVSV